MEAQSRGQVSRVQDPGSGKSVGSKVALPVELNNARVSKIGSSWGRCGLNILNVSPLVMRSVEVGTEVWYWDKDQDHKRGK